MEGLQSIDYKDWFINQKRVPQKTLMNIEHSMPIINNYVLMVV